jgi:sulfonate transport system ATP-binding protein
MANLLNVSAVSKRYGALEVVTDASFGVAEGEVVSLVGPSGCGKSTLLRIAAGLDRQFTGEMTAAGDPIQGPNPKVGVVFQEPRLMPWLSVRANISFGVRGQIDPVAVESVAEQVGLSDFLDVLPRQLSGGMAQRVAIARGLITEPAVLLLDEPFSAVDAFTRMHLQDLLLSIIAKRKATMLMVTHDVDEALYLSDRVIVMSPRPGRIQAEIPVRLPRPRDRRSPLLSSLRSEVLTALFHEVSLPKQRIVSPWF